MKLMLKLLHFKRQGFDLISEELVRRLQFSGIIRRSVKVFQHIVLIRRFVCPRNPEAKQQAEFIPPSADARSSAAYASRCPPAAWKAAPA